MLSIQTNVNSMNAQENLRTTNLFQGRTIARLTSGYRINESGDDAAGLAIANKYRSDVTELQQGVRNANDGLSTLQIIDGGLNNISKILDRLKTLATQSASATFTGSRETLDDEFQSLLTEIDRQAANIGLGSGDDDAGENNANIEVFIGGGSATANSKVAIDLAGDTKLVNSEKLGLAGKSIAGGTVATDFNESAEAAGTYTTGTGFLNNNSTQKLHFATASGERVVELKGDANGLTATELISQINSGLTGTGISVKANSDGTKLQLSSTSSFAAYAEAAVGTTTKAAMAAHTDGADGAVVNAGKYTFKTGAVSTVADESKTFTLAVGSDSADLTVAVDDTADMQAQKAKAEFGAVGVDVLRLGNNMFFSANKDFTVTRGADADSSDPWASTDLAAADDVAEAADATGSTDPTSGALEALSAIASAVDSLGSVQGTVGTGQNRLQYAIQLAQSQITSFSAAESRIRDADVAQEAANLTKAQVLQQASLAALAQANSAPQAVLSLLRG